MSGVTGKTRLGPLGDHPPRFGRRVNHELPAQACRKALETVQVRHAHDRGGGGLVRRHCGAIEIRAKQRREALVVVHGHCDIVIGGLEPRDRRLLVGGRGRVGDQEVCDAIEEERALGLAVVAPGPQVPRGVIREHAHRVDSTALNLTVEGAVIERQRHAALERINDARLQCIDLPDRDRKLGRRGVRDFFKLIQFRVLESKQTADGPPLSEATVTLEVEGAVEHTAAFGDGPVNALDNALRKALAGFYPRLNTMRLVDFKVRVLAATESYKGTGSLVRVLIESADQHGKWVTVGVSPNIIEASWQALIDSVNYKLYKDENENRKKKLGD